MSELLLAIKSVEDALGNIGVYPKAITKNYGTPEEETIPRVTWQDGWNACYMALSKNIWDQLTILEKEIDLNFAILSLVDVGWVKGDKFILNMNDTFHYAADSEEITKEQAREVVKLFEKHGLKGIDYWVACQRGYDPEVPHYKKRVEEVRLQESR